MLHSSTGSSSRDAWVREPIIDEVRRFYDSHHLGIERARQARRYFYGYLERVLRIRIPPGLRVLDVGCGAGHLLRALEPSRGVGIDISGQAIASARAAGCSHLQFLEGDGSDPAVLARAGGPFDVIVLVNVVTLLTDVQATFEALQAVCHPGTRLLIYSYSRLWQPLLRLAELLRLKYRQPPEAWLPPEEIRGMLGLADFEVVRSDAQIVFPARVPLLADVLNRFVGHLPGFEALSLMYGIIARPAPPCFRRESTQPSVSVVIPCRNEEGHIAGLVERLPRLQPGSEFLFIEGNSKDDTEGAIRRAIEAHPELPLRFLKQRGRGKGDAVREGFAAATGDILMILDADLTMPPEELPKFYAAWPRARPNSPTAAASSTRWRNAPCSSSTWWPTTFSADSFSWLLGQRVKDTLCGTKALRRDDYQKHCRQPRVLRRIRSIRRFRPALRRRQAEPPDRRHPHPLPGTHLRRHQHPALGARLAPPAHGALRRPEAEVHLMPEGGRRRLPGRIWPTLLVLATLVDMHGVFTTSRIFFFRDLASYFWPHHVWLRRALRSGTLPLWDRNAGLGYASVADPALQLFFLPTLVLRLLLPEVVGFNLGVALPFPLAALGTYRFLRGHLPASSAALGGFVYALSGPLLSASNCTNLAWCGALIPWVLRLVDRLKERPSARGLAALAALFACGICAGEPVTLAATGALAAAYAAFGDRRGWRQRWRITMATLAGGLLGLLLASVQVLPLVDATQRSIRGAGLLEDQWSLHPLLLAETMAPRLFGNHLGTLREVGPWLRPLSGDRSPYLLSLYLGPGVLILACLGAVAGRSRRRARFWTAAALVAAVVSLGRYTPVYPFLQGAVPLLRTFRYPAKYAIFSAFALAVLTALGWRALAALARGRRGHALVASTMAAALFGGTAATALAMVLLSPEMTHTLATRLAAGAGLRDPVAGASFLAASLLAAAPRLLVLASAGVACLWVGASRRSEAPMARTALFMMIGLDLLVANADLNPTMDAALLREPSWTSALGEHPEDRVYITRELVPSARPLDPDLPPPPRFSPDVTAVRTLAAYGSVLPAFPSAWGLREVIAEELTGLRPKEYLDLLLKYTWSDREARTRFLVRAGARYHLLPRPPSPDARALVLLQGLPPLALYEGPAPAPRVSVVPSGSVGPGVPQQIARLFDATFDPSAQVLLDTESEPFGTPGEASHAWATIAAESPTEILAQAAVPSPSAYLLLLDAFDTHWVVTVDGRPARLLRANGLFRAVRLVRGRHTVRFAYRSRPFQMGLTLSLFTALGLAAGAAVRGRREPV